MTIESDISIQYSNIYYELFNSEDFDFFDRNISNTLQCPKFKKTISSLKNMKK